MNYRTDLLFPSEALAASGTKTIDITYRKPISRFEITYKTTKGLQYMTAGPPANIPKIELVDGSTPLHSLTGYTNQALAYYNRPGCLLSHGQHLTGESETDVYPIDFGRYLHDPLFAFDPLRFANPQLKITYNRALADTSASAGSLEIWAELFDEKVITPIGFLSAREMWAGSFLANNSVNEVLLPEDEVIRQILVRANQAAYEPWYQVDIAKLDEAGSGRVIFDYADLEMFFRRMKSRWPLISYPFQGMGTAAGSVFYLPSTEYWGAFLGIQQSGAVVAYVSAGGARGGKLTIYAASSVQITGLLQGWLPWHTFQFPMGKQDDPDDWYDPTGKKPRLRLTSNTGGTSGDGNVVIETIHKY